MFLHAESSEWPLNTGPKNADESGETEVRGCLRFRIQIVCKEVLGEKCGYGLLIPLQMCGFQVPRYFWYLSVLILREVGRRRASAGCKHVALLRAVFGESKTGAETASLPRMTCTAWNNETR